MSGDSREITPETLLEIAEQERSADFSEAARRGHESSLVAATNRILMLSRLDDLVAWGRKNSIWPFKKRFEP